MSNVEEIKDTILKILEDGSMRSGTLVKKVVQYGYNQHKENGSKHSLYDYAEISKAVYELYMNDTIECCCDDEGSTCYRLPPPKKEK